MLLGPGVGALGDQGLGGEGTVHRGEKSGEIMESGQMGARAVCSALWWGLQDGTRTRTRDLCGPATAALAPSTVHFCFFNNCLNFD